MVYLYHHFNTRPHGGRQVADTAIFLSSISTHALTEGDYELTKYDRIVEFQLTPSRRATSVIEQVQQLRNISTHALTEGDKLLEDCLRKIIISTHALTEGDRIVVDLVGLYAISTHALTEGDNSRSTSQGFRLNFNSRPHGGRPYFSPHRGHWKNFNSRPHGGRPYRRAVGVYISISTHALTEGDLLRNSVKS